MLELRGTIELCSTNQHFTRKAQGTWKLPSSLKESIVVLKRVFQVFFFFSEMGVIQVSLTSFIEL